MEENRYPNLRNFISNIRNRKKQENFEEFKQNWNDLKNDPRLHTSRVIYEKNRKRKLQGKVRSILVFSVSIILTLVTIALMGVLQYDDYFAFVNQRYDYLIQFKDYCDTINFGNVDVISTPIAGFLTIIYIVIYKRREFLVDKLRYRNIGLPMITSCWSKQYRFYSAIVYGVIAYNVFNVIKNLLIPNEHQIKLPFEDPTGLLKLLIKIFEVIMIGISKLKKYSFDIIINTRRAKSSIVTTCIKLFRVIL